MESWIPTEEEWDTLSASYSELKKFHGWAFKKGDVRKNFKRRFFRFGRDEEMMGSMLKLFYCENENSKKHLNYIAITSETQVTEGFSSRGVPSHLNSQEQGLIISSHGRDYMLIPEDEVEAVQWVLKLRSLIHLEGLRERYLQARREKGALLSRRDTARGMPSPSIDVLLLQADGLEHLPGNEFSVRLACYSPATATFAWWEYTPSSAVTRDKRGSCVWNESFAWEQSDHSVLCMRLTDAQGTTVYGEARTSIRGLDAMDLEKDMSSWEGWLDFTAPLPADEEMERLHNGGVEFDLSREKGQMGRVKFRLSYSYDSLLMSGGVVGDPLPFRVSTGDVILFGGQTTAARFTKLFTWSKWSHAAMIMCKGKSVFVLEATGDGVCMWPIDTIWSRYHRDTALALCKLEMPKPLTHEDNEKLQIFVDSVIGRPYETNMIHLLGKVAKRESKSRLKIGEEERPKSGSDPGLRRLFCSELVAAGYRAMGLLPEDSDVSFLPKHFDASESQSGPHSLLLRGASVGLPRTIPPNPFAEL